MISQDGDRPWLHDMFDRLTQSMDAETMITGYETSYDSTGIYTDTGGICPGIFILEGA